MYIVVVFRTPPLVSTFALPLWSAPSIYIQQLYHELSRENQTQRSICLFDQYLPELTGHWHRLSRPSKYTSGAFCALVHQHLFPCTFVLSDVTRQEFNKSLQRVTHHDMTQPYLVRLQELHTIIYSCTYSCYWSIVFAFSKWSLSAPFDLPMTMLVWRKLKLLLPNS